MPKTIIQKVVFKDTTARALYALYMNPKMHGMITGGPVKISERSGKEFNVFDGYITGTNLKVIKDQLIVQSWRASNWGAKDADSTFMLSFEQRGKNVIMNVVHANVPEARAANLNKGWHDHYWNPWKQYLAGKPITRPES